MKALTLKQPWASWIAKGWKAFETRPHARYAGLVGQRIAIHAGQTIDRHAAAEAMAAGPSLWTELTPIVPIPQGAIVATALVVEHRPFHPEDAPAAMCRWAPRRFALVLAEVRRVEPPVECGGLQGAWTVAPNIEALVNERSVGLS